MHGEEESDDELWGAEEMLRDRSALIWSGSARSIAVDGGGGGRFGGRCGG